MNNQVIIAVVALAALVLVFGFRAATLYPQAIESVNVERISDNPDSSTFLLSWSASSPRLEKIDLESGQAVHVGVNNDNQKERDRPDFSDYRTDEYTAYEVSLSNSGATVNPQTRLRAPSTANYENVVAKCKVTEGPEYGGTRKIRMTCDIDGTIKCVKPADVNIINGECEVGALTGGYVKVIIPKTSAPIAVVEDSSSSTTTVVQTPQPPTHADPIASSSEEDTTQPSFLERLIQNIKDFFGRIF